MENPILTDLADSGAIANNLQSHSENESEQHCLLLREAIHESACFAIPFALSRVAIAIQNLGNGIVIRILSDDAATAAAPVMFMFQHGITGTARGALSTVSVVVSDLNGQSKYKKIGSAINQGLMLSFILGVPTSILFFTSASWLGLLGIDQDVAQQASKYLQALSYGIIPTYLTTVDQNFLLSIKRNRAPIMLNTLFVASSMAIGYPLTLSKLGLAGLGYGVSAASIITFIVGRCYMYFNRVDGVLDREKYNLFTRSFDSSTPFVDLLGLSLPTALQALSEWLPTLLIATITASGPDAENTLEAEQPSMQMLIMLNQILLGLGTAATVSVSNALGRARACAASGKLTNELIWKKNARTIGYADLVVTTLTILFPALFCMIYPDPIVWVFSDNIELYSLACSMLRVTGATLIVDGIRNTTTGAILGKKNRADNFFTSISNLAITGAAATTLGYVCQDKIGALSFFLFRMIGIFITSTLLIYWWEQQSKTIEVNDLKTPLLRGLSRATDAENAYPGRLFQAESIKRCESAERIPGSRNAKKSFSCG